MNIAAAALAKPFAGAGGGGKKKLAAPKNAILEAAWTFECARAQSPKRLHRLRQGWSPVLSYPPRLRRICSPRWLSCRPTDPEIKQYRNLARLLHCQVKGDVCLRSCANMRSPTRPPEAYALSPKAANHNSGTRRSASHPSNSTSAGLAQVIGPQEHDR
jgi:hypothetical protein